MKCKNCGYELNDDDKFCRNCGVAVQLEDDFSQQEEKVQENIGNDPGLILKNGIIGLALSELGLPGLIISCKALKLVKQDMNNGIAITGKRKVGRCLAIAGKIVGITMTVIWTIYLLIVIGVLVYSI